MVPSTDIGTFAVRITRVLDGNHLPVGAAPPAVVVPLVGHVEPLVRATRVRPLRDEGLECVLGVIPDEDVVAGVRLEGTTMKDE